MIAATLRNVFRQWWNTQSKTYWAQDWTLRNPVMKLHCEESVPLTLTAWTQSGMYDESHWRALPDIPNVSCAAVLRECYGPTHRTLPTNQVRSKCTPGLHQHYEEGSSWPPSPLLKSNNLALMQMVCFFSVHIHLLLTCVKFCNFYPNCSPVSCCISFTIICWPAICNNSIHSACRVHHSTNMWSDWVIYNVSLTHSCLYV